MIVDILVNERTSRLSGRRNVLQRGSPPPPPWRLSLGPAFAGSGMALSLKRLLASSSSPPDNRQAGRCWAVTRIVPGSCRPSPDFPHSTSRSTPTMLPGSESIQVAPGVVVLGCSWSTRADAMGLRPQEFEKLQARVRAAGRRPETVSTGHEEVGDGRRRHEVVLGIDPSLRGTGWGIIRISGGAFEGIGWGTLGCPSRFPRSRCLTRIAAGLREAIQRHRPTACAIEGLFYAQNLQTALLMGEARGVCLLAAAEAGLEICEIAPRKVKLAIVGYGGAQKTAVARMVQRILGLPETPDADSADALALALAHAREVSRPTLMPRRLL